jgi:hypothetical protein
VGPGPTKAPEDFPKLRIYYDTNINSGRILRDLRPDPEMEAVDALEKLHDAGILKRVSSKWYRIEQARTNDPTKRATLETRDDEMSCVTQDHRLLGFSHQDLGQLGFIASPIITDIVDEAIFEKLRAAGLAEFDAFHVMCAITGNCEVFVTVDTRDILPKRVEVEALCPQIRIRRPTELLAELRASGVAA